MRTNLTTEDYIKAIFKLQEAGGTVSTSALAAALSLADASVTDMLKKLGARGYVRYRRYQGVALSQKGRHAALKILRRHRLWEMYLVEVLGFSWDKIHDEADRLEHATSEELERRLDAALGFPRVDPHGDPIPDAGGAVRAGATRPLAASEPGEKLRVTRVSDGDPDLLQHAARIGLGLGRRVAVLEKRPFDGSMTLRVGRERRFVSREVARAVFVERA